MNQPNENSTELRILLDRALTDDPEAFNQLALCVTERLRLLARSMLRKFPQVKRWEDTDDVVQAALIRLHRSLSEVKPDSTRAFFGLAITQIRRSLIDLSRHYYGARGHGANHHSQGGGKAADDSGGVLAQAGGVPDVPDSLQDWTAFHEAIEALPDEEREAFGLIWYGGLMHKDIATLLNVSDKTVARRVNRARLRLHETLDGKTLDTQ